MRAADFLCPFTGRSADELHHASGRDANGEYLDPPLVVPLSLVQHNCEHTCWNVSEFGNGTQADPNVLRLRRVGHLLVRLGQHHPGGFGLLPGFFIEQLGLMLIRIAEDLEAI